MKGAEAGTADISVLIVVHRNRATIARCLAALEAQTVRPREVLLLENGSPDGERLRPGDVPDWATFVETPDNLGFAAGNNLLAGRARGRWLALLNPDAYAHPDWIEELARAFRRYPEVTLFGSTQLAADRPGVLDGAGDVYHASGFFYRSCRNKPVELLPAEGEVFAACGAAMAIRRDVFMELGGFEAKFFCYAEDVDLAFRARLAGHRVIQVRGAAVDHAGGASAGRGSDFGVYQGVRNQLWVFARCVPGWLLWALLPAHVLATFVLWLRAATAGEGLLFARAVRDGAREWRWLRASRSVVQATRSAALADIAAAMCWDVRPLVGRRPHVRPYAATPDPVP